MRGQAGCGHERGSAALELVIVAPAILLVAVLIVSGARSAGARTALQAVVREASRVAVEAPDARSAAEAAERLGREVAAGYQLDLARLEIHPTVGALVPGSRYEVVARYEVDLPVPGLGLGAPSILVEARHQEPVDPNRSLRMEAVAP